jgi:hypothetical protein
VLGVVEDPPESSVPSAPSVPPALSGQSPLVPEWVRGVVVPSDGAVVPSDGAAVLGEAEGSGLAAETTATPPATSSNPAIAAVRTARRTPLVFVSAGLTSTDGVDAGSSGWKVGSM